MIDGTFEPKALDPCDRAVESDPAHHPRMSKSARLAADLPDAPIGLLPDLFEVAEERGLQAPGFVLRLQLRCARGVQGVDQFPENIELNLIAGGVADPNR